MDHLKLNKNGKFKCKEKARKAEDAFGSDEHKQRTLDLLSSSLTAQPFKIYAGRLSQFTEFCHDSENISPLEATTATVVRFVTQASLIVYAPIPDYQPNFRALVTSVVNFMFFVRGLSGVFCRVRDVHVDDYNITLQVYREKGRAGRRRVLLLGLVLALDGSHIAAAASGHYRRGLLHSHDKAKWVKFQGSEFPESKYKSGEKPDNNCAQFPDQDYTWIAALNLGCKPKSGKEPVKIHKGDRVEGCSGDSPGDCPKHYDGAFDTCMSIIDGAVSGDNSKLYAEDGTWMTWNSDSKACFIYSETECKELGDEDTKDNSFQYCGLT
eukprot:jgi/Tetstr1/455990/TSEL_042768.t1